MPSQVSPIIDTLSRFSDIDGATEVGEALVADRATREADQDRSQGAEALEVRDLPAG